MKNTFVIALIFLLFALPSFVHAQNICGFDHALKTATDNDPTKKVALDQFLTQVQSYKGGSQVLGGNVNYIIPVVVHVIHDNGVSNISDAQVKDAIRILNEDFQKRNADTSAVVSAFKSIIADVGVEFRLAAIDPNGRCTSGITRTFSYLTNAGSGSAQKSLINWDTQKYYNIWVVNYLEAGGNAVGGYSYLPGTAPNSEKEGSIIVNKQFGNIGTSYGSALARATTTHETGHFLGLYHTWGFSYAAGSSSACGEDDGVSDTPNTSGTLNSCNTSQVTCGTLDNVQNYMDYSLCPYMFTNGQKTRMLAALNSNAGFRSNLWSPNNLIATGVNDGYIVNECTPKVDFSVSRNFACTGDTVNFYDHSYNDSLTSNRNWVWTFEGATPSSSTAQQPTVSYSLPGKYKIKLKVSNAHGADSIEKLNFVEIYNSDTRTYVNLSEGFENTSFPVNDDSSKSWIVSTPSNTKFTRTTTARKNGLAALGLDLHTETGCNHALVSPNFDLTAATAPLNYTFDFAYAPKNANSTDFLKVYASIDCGLTWSLKGSKTASELKTKEATTSAFIPSVSEWNSMTINLNAYAGKASLQIKTVVGARGGNTLYIDNAQLFHGNVGLSALESDTFSATIYPNPITENSVLHIESAKSTNISIEVQDVLGRKISNAIAVQSSTIVLSDLIPTAAKGIYFIKISNGITIKTISILF